MDSKETKTAQKGPLESVYKGHGGVHANPGSADPDSWVVDSHALTRYQAPVSVRTCMVILGRDLDRRKLSFGLGGARRGMMQHDWKSRVIE